MAFNLNDLGKWIRNEHKNMADQIFKNSETFQLLLEHGTALIDRKPGVEALLMIDVGSNWNNSSCSRNGGDTKISNKYIETVGIQDDEFFCSKDLYATYAAYVLKKGMSPNGEFDPTFLTHLEELKTKSTGATAETAIWMSDKTSAYGNLNKFDGFIKLLKNDPLVGNLTSSATNIITRLQEDFNSIDPDISVADDFRIFIGRKMYNQYLTAVYNSSNYNETTKEFLAGTDAKFAVLPGLNDFDGYVMCRIRDLVVSTDLVSDVNTIDTFYDAKDRGVYMDIDFALGVQIYRSEYMYITNKNGTTCPLPVIVTQPTDQSVDAGDDVTFTVVATGATNYQWQENVGGTGWVNISGANADTYVKENVAIGDNGTEYRVIVSNNCGTATTSNVNSDPATLTVA